MTTVPTQTKSLLARPLQLKYKGGTYHHTSRRHDHEGKEGRVYIFHLQKGDSYETENIINGEKVPRAFVMKVVPRKEAKTTETFCLQMVAQNPTNQFYQKYFPKMENLSVTVDGQDLAQAVWKKEKKQLWFMSYKGISLVDYATPGKGRQSQFFKNFRLIIKKLKELYDDFVKEGIYPEDLHTGNVTFEEEFKTIHVIDLGLLFLDPDLQDKLETEIIDILSLLCKWYAYAAIRKERQGGIVSALQDVKKAEDYVKSIFKAGPKDEGPKFNPELHGCLKDGALPVWNYEEGDELSQTPMTQPELPKTHRTKPHKPKKSDPELGKEPVQTRIVLKPRRDPPGEDPAKKKQKVDDEPNDSQDTMDEELREPTEEEKQEADLQFQIEMGKKPSQPPVVYSQEQMKKRENTFYLFMDEFSQKENEPRPKSPEPIVEEMQKAPSRVLTLAERKENLDEKTRSLVFFTPAPKSQELMGQLHTFQTSFSDCSKQINNFLTYRDEREIPEMMTAFETASEHYKSIQFQYDCVRDLMFALILDAATPKYNKYGEMVEKAKITEYQKNNYFESLWKFVRGDEKYNNGRCVDWARLGELIIRLNLLPGREPGRLRYVKAGENKRLNLLIQLEAYEAIVAKQHLLGAIEPKG